MLLAIDAQLTRMVRVGPVAHLAVVDQEGTVRVATVPGSMWEYLVAAHTDEPAEPAGSAPAERPAAVSPASMPWLKLPRNSAVPPVFARPSKPIIVS